MLATENEQTKEEKNGGKKTSQWNGKYGLRDVIVENGGNWEENKAEKSGIGNIGWKWKAEARERRMKTGRRKAIGQFCCQ
jgi:hypothetical protein